MRRCVIIAGWEWKWSARARARDFSALAVGIVSHTRNRRMTCEHGAESEQQGETHLFTVAKFDVSLDNTTVIHHCRGPAPLPHAASWYSSHYRVRSAELPRRDTICGTRRPHRAVPPILPLFPTKTDGITAPRITRQNPYRERSVPSTDCHLDNVGLLRALARFSSSSRARNTYSAM